MPRLKLQCLRMHAHWDAETINTRRGDWKSGVWLLGGAEASTVTNLWRAPVGAGQVLLPHLADGH